MEVVDNGTINSIKFHDEPSADDVIYDVQKQVESSSSDQEYQSQNSDLDQEQVPIGITDEGTGKKGEQCVSLNFKDEGDDVPQNIYELDTVELDDEADVSFKPTDDALESESSESEEEASSAMEEDLENAEQHDRKEGSCKLVYHNVEERRADILKQKVRDEKTLDEMVKEAEEEYDADYNPMEADNTLSDVDTNAEEDAEEPWLQDINAELTKLADGQHMIPVPESEMKIPDDDYEVEQEENESMDME